MTVGVRTTLIGRSVPKVDGRAKASGATRYLHDLTLPGMLYGKILRAGRPHARIVRVDTSRAQALPGVHAVITAADVKQAPLGFGRDNPPLKGDKVRCVRDEIAAVAAESEEIAAEALRLIQVEFEDLPAVFSPREALRPGAPLIHEEYPGNVRFTYHYSHGDIRRGEDASDVIVEDTFHLHYVTHCCLGPSVVLAFFDPDGNLTIYSQTQAPFLYKRDIAPVIGVPPEKIRVIQPPIAGAFGSKLDIYPFEPICVYLAKATGRPVKIQFTREEEFIASPTRQPVEIRVRSGAKKDGTLTFRDVETLHDNGGYTSWGATTPFVMMQTFSSLYRVPHCRYRTTVVYTNNPYSGSFRGYGNLQATFVVESHMDRLAEAVGMDPLSFRLKNAQESGEKTPQGLVFKTCGLKECLKTAARAAGFLEKHAAYARTRGEGGPVKRGIGIAALLHVGGGAKIYRSDGCGTILKLDDFGKATVITGATEIGQGSDTGIAMIVAEVLGLPLDHVRIVNDDSEVKPWDVGVHASRTTFIAGNSARRAALKARAKILRAAAEQTGLAPEALDLKDGQVVRAAGGEPLLPLGKLIRSLHFAAKHDLVMTTDYYEPPSQMQDKEYRGDVSATYAFAAQVAEVEVDTETGIVRVLKVTSAHDIGRVINRLGAEGQVEGGIVMGTGYATREELLVREGRVLNPSFRDYKLLTAPEIPEIEIHFIETEDPEGPFGAKGIGEAPAICLAPAVANAVYNATGVRFTALPLTPERVWRHLRSSEG